MIHIKRDAEVPRAFKSDAIKSDIKKYQAFFRRSAATRTQEGFKEPVNGDTRETLEAVARQFKHKCAACETALNIRQVICDSWRPRQHAKGFEEEFAQDHYWWLSYEWGNKYCLCADCNKFKGTWFPVKGKRAPLNTSYAKIVKQEAALLIDPCSDYPEEHLLADENGKLLCLTEKGEVTIELLKLNRAELVAERKKVIHSVTVMLQAIEQEWKQPKKVRPESAERDSLQKLIGWYETMAAWLKNHPDVDHVQIRRQVVLTWLYLKPVFNDVDALKTLYPRCRHLVGFKSLEKFFRGFQLLVSGRSTRTDRTFKPRAILHPHDGYISRGLGRKDIEKIARNKQKVERSQGTGKSGVPVNTWSNLIVQGLEVISDLASNPLAKNLAAGAAGFIKTLHHGTKKVRLYPEKIEIKNFKSIARLNFDFKVPASDKMMGTSLTGHKEPWKFLLGENGVGKSSILQAISLVLAGEPYIQSLQLAPSELLKHGTRSGWVKIWFAGITEPAILTITPDTISCNFETGQVNVLGYGSTRVMPMENTSLQPENNNARVKVKNLFNYSVSLSDVKQWLLTIDQPSFDKVALALKDVLGLPSNHTYFIREGREIYFSKKKEKLSELSEGYRSVVALAVDIMKSLSEERMTTITKKEISLLTYDVMEGIVLIDEISSHLHPRWQMKIVKAFRRAFPKLQFIVTSHDPLSLKGIEHGEVLLLKRNEAGEVEGISNLPDPTELKAEQLLTSEFFGLSSTLDPDLEVQFNTYHYLLAKPQLTTNETTQLETLKNDLRQKRHLGDSLREELMYNVLDKAIARYGNQIETIDRQQLFDDTEKEVFKLWDEHYKA